MEAKILDRARRAAEHALTESRSAGEPKHSVDRATRHAVEVLSSLLSAETFSVTREDGEAPETYPVPWSEVGITEEFTGLLEIIDGSIDPDIRFLNAVLAVIGQLHSELLRVVEKRYGRLAAFGSQELGDAYAELEVLRGTFEELRSGEHQILQDPVRTALAAAERAEAAVGPAAESGLGTEYARIASNEEKLRDRARQIAVGGLLLFGLLSVVLLAIAPSDLGSRATAARAALSIPGATLFAYFSRQAALHRRVAQRASELAAQLKTVNAYVSQFDDRGAREDVLAQLANVVFREFDDRPPERPSRSPKRKSGTQPEDPDTS